MLDRLQKIRAQADTAGPSLPFNLPLVSVIVVNYNYGAFLREAVQSVLDQTYPFVECIVVDDRSTDDSPAILRDLKEKHPQIEYFVNEKNVGQSGSSLAALQRSQGDFIVFLDADDYLFPECVATHMEAHLSLRLPVGFTSVDMAELRNGRIVTTASPAFSEFIFPGGAITQNLYRGLEAPLGFAERPAPPRSLADDLHYVPPSQAGGWPWSPTSGNCFRRDALSLVMDNEHLASLRSCTDCYLLRGVACLAGSVLIDRPLVAYRLHGNNDFAKGASIHRIRPYDTGYLKHRSNQATKMLVDHIIRSAVRLKAQFEAPFFFEEVLDALDAVHPPIHETGYSYVTRQLLLHRDALREVFDVNEFDRWMVYRCAPGLLRGLLLRSPFARRLFNRFYLPRLTKSLRRATQRGE